MSATIISCKNKIETVSDVDLTNLPTEEVKNLKVLYTEGGVIKNEINTKLVKHYQFADTPYYAFPQGIYASSYKDSLITNPNAELIAEQAFFKESPDFFEAYNNVVLRNIPLNQKLETDTLFWSGATKKIFSHSPSIVIRPPDTIPALGGFVSDDQFKYYELIKARRGTVYYKTENDSTNNKTISDSTNRITPQL